MRFTDHFSAGIGVELIIFDVSDPICLVPITLNTKGYFPITANNELFISLDLGVVTFPDEGLKAGAFIINPAIGITFCEKFSASIGYDCMLPGDLSTIIVKLGYTY
ncbi:MAG: hypothetical protein R3Y22_02100 [Bacteroidales bacterium]